MSAAPAERPDPYRTQPHAGPRTVTQLRAALAAASAPDREEFEHELGELDLDDPEEYAALVRKWRHRLVMRTRPEILAAVAASADPAAPRWTSAEILDGTAQGDRPVSAGASWSVVYSDTGRAGLATATAEERAAILAFEKQLAEEPYSRGELYPDRVGGLYTALLTVGDRIAWTSVLYRIDEARREVLIVALISGP